MLMFSIQLDFKLDLQTQTCQKLKHFRICAPVLPCVMSEYFRK